MVAAPGVLANDTDATDPLTAAIETDLDPWRRSPSRPTAGFTYTPDRGYFGSDSFTYTANDGTVDSNPVTVSP